MRGVREEVGVVVGEGGGGEGLVAEEGETATSVALFSVTITLSSLWICKGHH